MAHWDKAKAKRQLAKDQQIAKLGQVGRKVAGTSGRCTLAVDQETYIRTIERNGGVQPDGRTVFDDPEYVSDMKQRHPHLRVPGEDLASMRCRRWGKTVSRGGFIDGVYHDFDFKRGEVRIDLPEGRKIVPMDEYEGPVL